MRNLKGKNNPAWKGGGIKLKCDFCKKIYRRQRWYVKKKNSEYHYCSIKCKNKGQAIYYIGNKSNLYIHGEYNKFYPTEFNIEIKNFIRSRDNNKCMNCGVPQKEFIKKLSIHHIDYNKNNNDPINLITLCNICNTKANRNRKYWQNYYENIQIERKVHLLEWGLSYG